VTLTNFDYLIRQALEILHHAHDEADPTEASTIASCELKLRGLASGRHKEIHAALGTTPALKFVARHAGGY
jgi:hypothetical protein